MEAARPGLLIVFDPVTGAVVFDSRRLSLEQVVTRRVLPQSGTLLVHGRRAAGPPVVALYDLATGDQRWVNEALFQQTEAPKKGLGGLMQRLVTAASEATALEVLQAGPDMIVVHTLMGLRALDARTGAVRWSATLPTARAGHPARPVRPFPALDHRHRAPEEGREDQGPTRLCRADARGPALHFAARPGDERRGEHHRSRHGRAEVQGRDRER